MWLCRLFGHRFEARFTELPRSIEKVELDAVPWHSHRDLATIRAYIGDVCPRCGSTRLQREQRTSDVYDQGMLCDSTPDSIIH